MSVFKRSNLSKLIVFIQKIEIISRVSLAFRSGHGGYFVKVLQVLKAGGN